MKRGDVVAAAMSGDYGKPRPAVVVQTNALPESHASVILCQMTSSIIVDEAGVRVTIEPNDANGLRSRSQIMVDKPVTARRERIGKVVGRLDPEDVARLDIAIAFVMGISD